MFFEKANGFGVFEKATHKKIGTITANIVKFDGVKYFFFHDTDIVLEITLPDNLYIHQLIN